MKAEPLAFPVGVTVTVYDRESGLCRTEIDRGGWRVGDEVVAYMVDRAPGRPGPLPFRLGGGRRFRTLAEAVAAVARGAGR